MLEPANMQHTLPANIGRSGFTNAHRLVTDVADPRIARDPICQNKCGPQSAH